MAADNKNKIIATLIKLYGYLLLNQSGRCKFLLGGSWRDLISETSDVRQGREYGGKGGYQAVPTLRRLAF
jgi:hypothetical protein